MSAPIYKIHGTERRKLKKELGDLKRFTKKFWHFHQLDKDMASIYGGSQNFPMSDEQAQIRFDMVSKNIKELEQRLSVPYEPQTQLE